MEVNFRQNVRVGLELVSALWSVRFTELSALDRLRYENLLKNWSGTNDTVRLREVSALEDVRLWEVSLYIFKLDFMNQARFHEPRHMLILFNSLYLIKLTEVF